MTTKILRFSLVGLLGMGLVFAADAAPTVKKLGGTTMVHSATPAKSDSASASRVGSIRLNTSNIGKPAIKTTTATTSNSNVLDSNESRISLGKYLHGANVVKQNAAQAAYEDPNLASRDSLILRDKLAETDSEVADVKQNLQDHIDNANIHVTLSEKERWNNKQDTLTEGAGISIKDGVISSIMKIPEGSETAPRTAPIWIE